MTTVRDGTDSDGVDGTDSDGVDGTDSDGVDGTDADGVTAPTSSLRQLHLLADEPKLVERRPTPT